LGRSLGGAVVGHVSVIPLVEVVRGRSLRKRIRHQKKSHRAGFHKGSRVEMIRHQKKSHFRGIVSRRRGFEILKNHLDRGARRTVLVDPVGAVPVHYVAILIRGGRPRPRPSTGLRFRIQGSRRRIRIRVIWDSGTMRIGPRLGKVLSASDAQVWCFLRVEG